MKELDLEKVCPVCSGKGNVDQDDVYNFRESLKFVSKQRATMEINNPDYRPGLSGIEDEYKKYFDLAVDSIESNGCNCLNCSGSGVTITKFGKTLLTFLEKYRDTK